MSTHIHSFVPLDPYFVPAVSDLAVALTWLRSEVDAYKIEAVTPGHVIFFDCGGGLDDVLCPKCRTDIGPLWKEWMDESYTEDGGFALDSRTLKCCGANFRLDQLIFNAPCAFGSFGIDIADTTTTLSNGEVAALIQGLEQRLSCPFRWMHASY
jgi:hypothetical protein